MSQKLDALIRVLSQESGQRLLCVPGVEAVAITIVGKNVPHGTIMFSDNQVDVSTLLLAADRSADQLKRIISMMEGGRANDEQNRSGLAEQGSNQHQSGADAADDHAQVADEAQAESEPEGQSS